MHNRLGKLLIAHPHFPERSPFAKSVVYVYQDDAVNGTVGVILNKKSRTSVQALADRNGVMFGDEYPIVHIGGPVNRDALILLHTNDWHSSNTASAGGNLRISSDNHMLPKLAQYTDQPIYWRLFVGAATWIPGQLDAEINGDYPYGSHQMWLTADADEDIIFEYDGEDQWIKAVDLCSQQTINHFF